MTNGAVPHGSICEATSLSSQICIGFSLCPHAGPRAGTTALMSDVAVSPAREETEKIRMAATQGSITFGSVHGTHDKERQVRNCVGSCIINCVISCGGYRFAFSPHTTCSRYRSSLSPPSWHVRGTVRRLGFSSLNRRCTLFFPGL